ncbi:MAG: hypothetical protein RKE49_06305 [Oceanicaulis sp.]
MDFQSLTEHGLISPDKLAALLRTTKAEIGGTLGLSAQALSRKDRVRAARVQSRLRHLLELVNTMEPVIGSPLLAYAWYRSEPIIGFGGRTPERIVKDGEIDALRAHIQRRLQGGYA